MSHPEQVDWLKLAKEDFHNLFLGKTSKPRQINVSSPRRGSLDNFPLGQTDIVRASVGIESEIVRVGRAEVGRAEVGRAEVGL